MAKTVLLVDDDPYILLAVEKFLKIKGLKVLTTTDPAQAFALAQKERPALIISDVSMPGIDGFTLLKELKANKKTKDIPIALLTATDKISDIDRGYEVGAQAYILKPIEWDRAWAKIEKFLFT
jgi:adenylate cyclase